MRVSIGNFLKHGFIRQLHVYSLNFNNTSTCVHLTCKYCDETRFEVVTKKISPCFFLFVFFLLKMILFLWHYVEKPGKASINSSESVIQATVITIRWTAPADDGGSPITGYRLILQKGETELEMDSITDPVTTTHSFRGLKKNTNYTVKLFSRNFVFEGDPTVRTMKTKFEGDELQVIS